MRCRYLLVGRVGALLTGFIRVVTGLGAGGRFCLVRDESMCSRGYVVCLFKSAGAALAHA